MTRAMPSPSPVTLSTRISCGGSRATMALLLRNLSKRCSLVNEKGCKREGEFSIPGSYRAYTFPDKKHKSLRDIRLPLTRPLTYASMLKPYARSGPAGRLKRDIQGPAIRNREIGRSKEKYAEHSDFCCACGCTARRHTNLGPDNRGSGATRSGHGGTADSGRARCGMADRRGLEPQRVSRSGLASHRRDRVARRSAATAIAR